MDYVVNYGSADQFRISVEVVEVTPENGPRRFTAKVNRIGAQVNPIATSNRCETAGEAERVAVEMMRHKCGPVECYQREKHRDLSTGKILKK